MSDYIRDYSTQNAVVRLQLLSQMVALASIDTFNFDYDDSNSDNIILNINFEDVDIIPYIILKRDKTTNQSALYAGCYDGNNKLLVDIGPTYDLDYCLTQLSLQPGFGSLSNYVVNCPDLKVNGAVLTNLISDLEYWLYGDKSWPEGESIAMPVSIEQLAYMSLLAKDKFVINYIAFERLRKAVPDVDLFYARDAKGILVIVFVTPKHTFEF